jgi:hypothetical protein
MLACAACPARLGSSNGEKGIAACIGCDATSSSVVITDQPARRASVTRPTGGDVTELRDYLEVSDASAAEISSAASDHPAQPAQLEEDDKSCGILSAAQAAAAREPLASAATDKLVRARAACFMQLRSSVSALSHWEVPPTAAQVRLVVLVLVPARPRH